MDTKKNDVKKKQNNAKKKQEIPKGVKKKRFHFERKQKIAVGVISIIAVASIVGIVGGIIIYINLPKGGTLIVGIMRVDNSIDPHEFIDSNRVIFENQVVEGLFDTDGNDPNNKIIPNLATEWVWSDNATELTCILRQDVKFHDETDFNAQAVKWSIDRLYRTIDRVYGNETAPLWQLPDGRWIINETQVIDDYTVKFVLNEPYVPLEGLLTHWSASILSPSSTPADEFIDLLTEDLVGTGPFIYDSYELDTEVRMSPNPNYWGGKPAIDELIFLIYSDINLMIDDVFSGKIHLMLETGPNILFAQDRIPDIYSNPSIIVDDAPVPTIYYLGMNNNKIPVEMRKAISYAIDYDYYKEDILWGGFFKNLPEDTQERVTNYSRGSPIPNGILYSNTEDFNVSVLDLVIARKTLQDANWSGTAGLPLDEDGPWEALVDADTPIATYNYSYSSTNPLAAMFLPLLQNNSKKIGVKIVNANMSWYDFHYRGRELHGFNRDYFELFQAYKFSFYNDPCEYINFCMDKAAADNFAQINDTQLQTWLEQAIRETNSTEREDLYYQIQKRFIEEIYPWSIIYVPPSLECFRSNLRGYASNFWNIVLKNAYFV